jgi:hypothetical protein
VVQTHWGTQNVVGDFTGDGRADILSLNVPPDNSQWRSALHTWVGLTAQTQPAELGGMAASAIAVAGDSDRDGVSDALVIDHTGALQALRAPGAFDVLQSIDNGLGGTVTLSYQRSGQLMGAMTLNGGNCVGVPSAEAWRCGHSDTRSRPLVTVEEHSTPGGTQQALYYSYWNGRILPGPAAMRADLGFEAFTVSEPATHLVHETWYYQAKPYQRFEHVRRIYTPGLDGGQLELERVEDALPTQVLCDEGGCVVDGMPDPAAPRLLEATAQTTTYKELDRPLYSITRNFTYDD